MEIDACEKTVEEVDLVLMDGSLHSQFMTRQSALDFTIPNGFVGPSVPIVWKSGEIRIINLCKDLMIIQSGKQIKTLLIYHKLLKHL